MADYGLRNDDWLFLLLLAGMSGITPETIQKRKEEDEKLKEYADWCPARKTECGTGTTYQICMKTGEICDGCQEFHFNK